jgi:hypothetical protein
MPGRIICHFTAGWIRPRPLSARSSPAGGGRTNIARSQPRELPAHRPSPATHKYCSARAGARLNVGGPKPAPAARAAPKRVANLLPPYEGSSAWGSFSPPPLGPGRCTLAARSLHLCRRQLPKKLAAGGPATLPATVTARRPCPRVITRTLPCLCASGLRHATPKGPRAARSSPGGGPCAHPAPPAAPPAAPTAPTQSLQHDTVRPPPAEAIAPAAAGPAAGAPTGAAPFPVSAPHLTLPILLVPAWPEQAKGACTRDGPLPCPPAACRPPRVAARTECGAVKRAAPRLLTTRRRPPLPSAPPIYPPHFAPVHM